MAKGEITYISSRKGVLTWSVTLERALGSDKEIRKNLGTKATALKAVNGIKLCLYMHIY